MENSKQPAFPVDLNLYHVDGGGYDPTGLTKLEHASIMAMNGILADGQTDNIQIIAKAAIMNAKELLKQLEEEK